MIHLLYGVLFTEAVMALLLCVNIPPLRKLIVRMLDQTKMGKVSVIRKTLAATMCLIFASIIASIFRIQRRMLVTSTVNPTDQILIYKHLLETSLTGFILFLAIMIDRLHYYIRDLPGLLINMESLRKQAKNTREEYFRLQEEKEALKSSMESLGKQAKDVLAMKEEITLLQQKLEKASQEMKAKDEQIRAAEANAIALTKQSESLLLEYDRLLEENQHLRTQLSTMDKKFSRSDSKKRT